MYEDCKKDFPAVKDISPLEAMKLMATGQAVFVDIRKASEIEVSMLSDALTEEAFLKNFSKYRSRTFIAYCTIGDRSGKSAREMVKKGVDMHNLRVGLLAWVLEGGSVYDANGETRRVHVYGEKWNYLPGGYEPIMFGFFEKLFSHNVPIISLRKKKSLSNAAYTLSSGQTQQITFAVTPQPFYFHLDH